MKTFRTAIRGLDAEWTPEVMKKWTTAIANFEHKDKIVSANYFTPRPYVDQYNSGSREEGFTYTIKLGYDFIISTLDAVPR